MNTTMAGRIRKLRDMDIDEISLVDRAANQHASILFSKAQEDAMPGYDESVELYDTDGNPADFEQLDVGDVAYDDQGNEYVMVEDDGSDGEYGEYEEAAEYAEDGELIGKAGYATGLMGLADNTSRGARGFARGARHRAVAQRGRTAARDANPLRRRRSRKLEAEARTALRQTERGPLGAGINVDAPSRGSRLTEAGMRYRYAPTTPTLAAGFAGGGAAGAGGMYAYDKRNVKKSLGDVLIEELSKSDQADRQLDMAGALGDEIEKAQQQAAAAIDYAEQLHEERALEAFVSKAAEYNLPVDAYVLGEILKSASQVLDREQLDVLDELFTAIGDDLYDELGAVGGGDNSDILAQVDAYADELVGKSQGGVSQAEASTMLFEANPEAYELYLQENGRY